MVTTTIKFADGTTLDLDLDKAEDCLKLFEKIKEFIQKDNILDSWISSEVAEAFLTAKKKLKRDYASLTEEQKKSYNHLKEDIKDALEKQSKVKYAFAFLWHKVIKGAALSVAGFVKKQVDKVTRAWARRQSRKADEKVAKIEKERDEAKKKVGKKEAELDKAKEQQVQRRARLDELDPPTVDAAFRAEVNYGLDAVVADLPSSAVAAASPAPAAVAASPVVSSTADPLAGGVASSRANTPPPSPSRSPGTPSPPASPSGGTVFHTVAASPANPATPHGSAPPSQTAPGSGAGAVAGAGAPAVSGDPNPSSTKAKPASSS